MKFYSVNSIFLQFYLGYIFHKLINYYHNELIKATELNVIKKYLNFYQYANIFEIQQIEIHPYPGNKYKI